MTTKRKFTTVAAVGVVMCGVIMLACKRNTEFAISSTPILMKCTEKYIVVICVNGDIQVYSLDGKTVSRATPSSRPETYLASQVAVSESGDCVLLESKLEKKCFLYAVNSDGQLTLTNAIETSKLSLSNPTIITSRFPHIVMMYDNGHLSTLSTTGGDVKRTKIMSIPPQIQVEYLDAVRNGLIIHSYDTAYYYDTQSLRLEVVADSLDQDYRFKYLSGSIGTIKDAYKMAMPYMNGNTIIAYIYSDWIIFVIKPKRTAISSSRLLVFSANDFSVYADYSVDENISAITLSNDSSEVFIGTMHNRIHRYRVSRQRQVQ